MTIRSIAVVFTVVIAVSLISGPSTAQIPDEFKNLKVLPKDISKKELTGIMRSFSGALGVRCLHCHVGEDPHDLSTFDFASDEKEPKETARAMMKMVGEINNKIIPAIGIEDPTQVRCVTCHRGLDDPQTLDNLLLKTTETDGADAADARYRELREEYYGKGSYDFGPGTLSTVAEKLAQEKNDITGAVAMARLNVEFNPDQPFAQLLLGQLLVQSGDTEGGILAIEKCLELDPNNRWAQQMLQRVRTQDNDNKK